MNGVPAGVCDGEHRAGAGSPKVIDGNIFLFKHAQHAQMRDTSRESASQRHAYARPAGRLGSGRLRVSEFTNALDRILEPLPDFLFIWSAHLPYRTVYANGTANWMRRVSR